MFPCVATHGLMKMKTVAIYYRVSTHHQSTDSQAVELQRYCQQRNLTIFKEYSDITSGAKSDRPSLSELLSDAKKRKFDAVIVFRFDRMARSSTHLLSVLNEFKSLNIDFMTRKEYSNKKKPNSGKRQSL